MSDLKEASFYQTIKWKNEHVIRRLKLNDQRLKNYNIIIYDWYECINCYCLISISKDKSSELVWKFFPKHFTIYNDELCNDIIIESIIK